MRFLLCLCYTIFSTPYVISCPPVHYSDMGNCVTCRSVRCRQCQISGIRSNHSVLNETNMRPFLKRAFAHDLRSTFRYFHGWHTKCTLYFPHASSPSPFIAVSPCWYSPTCQICPYMLNFHLYLLSCWLDLHKSSVLLCNPSFLDCGDTQFCICMSECRPIATIAGRCSAVKRLLEAILCLFMNFSADRSRASDGR
jgi:hypothetical protein